MVNNLPGILGVMWITYIVISTRDLLHDMYSIVWFNFTLLILLVLGSIELGEWESQNTNKAKYPIRYLALFVFICYLLILVFNSFKNLD